MIERSAYDMLNIRFSKALTASEDWTLEEGKEGAEEDWRLEVESKGHKWVDFELFYTSIFEIVDIWCYGITSWEYVDCLQKLIFAVLDENGILRDIDTIASLEDDRQHGRYTVSTECYVPATLHVAERCSA